MPVTMEEVAVAAGVTRSTVSRALANSPRVKLVTRLRIQRIAREMGYIPNVVARGLATKRTSNLGILLYDIAEVSVAEMMREIDHVARRFDYHLLLSHCGRSDEDVRHSVNQLLERQVDAIIVADRSLTDTYPLLLENTHLPVIVINAREARYPVSTDNIAAARQGVEHLLDLGHRAVGFIGSSRAAVESQERQAGYEAALRNRGIEPRPEQVVVPPEYAACDAGAAGMEQLLRQFPSLTAVFCFNDLTALGAMSRLWSAGRHVPDDISVLGFDNISLAPHTVPPLTTLAQQRGRIAELVVEAALDALAEKEPSPRELLSCELVRRASTAPPTRVG